MALELHNADSMPTIEFRYSGKRWVLVARGGLGPGKIDFRIV
jgi:hypothetical protein